MNVNKKDNPPVETEITTPLYGSTIESRLNYAKNRKKALANVDISINKSTGMFNNVAVERYYRNQLFVEASRTHSMSVANSNPLVAFGWKKEGKYRDAIYNAWMSGSPVVNYKDPNYKPKKKSKLIFTATPAGPQFVTEEYFEAQNKNTNESNKNIPPEQYYTEKEKRNQRLSAEILNINTQNKNKALFEKSRQFRDSLEGSAIPQHIPGVQVSRPYSSYEEIMSQSPYAQSIKLDQEKNRARLINDPLDRNEKVYQIEQQQKQLIDKFQKGELLKVVLGDYQYYGKEQKDQIRTAFDNTTEEEREEAVRQREKSIRFKYSKDPQKMQDALLTLQENVAEVKRLSKEGMRNPVYKHQYNKALREAKAEEYMRDYTLSPKQNVFQYVDSIEQFKAIMPYISSEYNSYANTNWLPDSEIDWEDLYNANIDDLHSGHLLNVKNNLSKYYSKIIGKNQPFFIKDDVGNSKAGAFIRGTAAGLQESAIDVITMVPALIGSAFTAVDLFTESYPEQLDADLNYFQRIGDNFVNHNMFADQAHKWSEGIIDGTQAYGTGFFSTLAQNGFTAGALIGDVVAFTTGTAGTKLLTKIPKGTKLGKSMIAGSEEVNAQLMKKVRQEVLDAAYKKEVNEAIQNINKRLAQSGKSLGDASKKRVADEVAKKLEKTIKDNPKAFDDVIETNLNKRLLREGKILNNYNVVKISCGEAMQEGLSQRDVILQEAQNKKETIKESLRQSIAKNPEAYPMGEEEYKQTAQRLQEEQYSTLYNQYYKKYKEEYGESYSDTQIKGMAAQATASTLREMIDQEARLETAFNKYNPNYDEKALIEANRASRAIVAEQTAFLAVSEIIGGGLLTKLLPFKFYRGITKASQHNLSNRMKVTMQGDRPVLSLKGKGKEIVKTGLQITRVPITETIQEIVQSLDSQLHSDAAVLNLENYVVNSLDNKDGVNTYDELSDHHYRLLRNSGLLWKNAWAESNIPQVIKSTMISTMIFGSPSGWSHKTAPQKQIQGESNLGHLMQVINYINPFNTAWGNILNEHLVKQRGIQEVINMTNKFYSNPENVNRLHGLTAVSNYSKQAMEAVANGKIEEFETNVYAAAVSEAIAMARTQDLEFTKNKVSQLENMANVKSLSKEELKSVIEEFRKESGINIESMTDEEVIDTIEKNGKRLSEVYKKAVEYNKKYEDALQETDNPEQNELTRNSLLFGMLMRDYVNDATETIKKEIEEQRAINDEEVRGLKEESNKILDDFLTERSKSKVGSDKTNEDRKEAAKRVHQRAFESLQKLGKKYEEIRAEKEGEKEEDWKKRVNKELKIPVQEMFRILSNNYFSIEEYLSLDLGTLNFFNNIYALGAEKDKDGNLNISIDQENLRNSEIGKLQLASLEKASELSAKQSKTEKTLAQNVQDFNTMQVQRESFHTKYDKFMSTPSDETIDPFVAKLKNKVQHRRINKAMEEVIKAKSPSELEKTFNSTSDIEDFNARKELKRRIEDPAERKKLSPKVIESFKELENMEKHYNKLANALNAFSFTTQNLKDTKYAEEENKVLFMQVIYNNQKSTLIDKLRNRFINSDSIEEFDSNESIDTFIKETVGENPEFLGTEHSNKTAEENLENIMIRDFMAQVLAKVLTDAKNKVEAQETPVVDITVEPKEEEPSKVVGDVEVTSQAAKVPEQEKEPEPIASEPDDDDTTIVQDDETILGTPLQDAAGNPVTPTSVDPDAAASSPVNPDDTLDDVLSEPEPPAASPVAPEPPSQSQEPKQTKTPLRDRTSNEVQQDIQRALNKERGESLADKSKSTPQAFTILEANSKDFQNEYGEVNRTSHQYTSNTGKKFVRFHDTEGSNTEEASNRPDESRKLNSKEEIKAAERLLRGDRFDTFMREYLSSDRSTEAFNEAVKAAEKLSFSDKYGIQDSKYGNYGQITEDTYKYIRTAIDKLLPNEGPGSFDIKTKNLIVSGIFKGIIRDDSTGDLGLRIAGEMDCLLYKDGIYYILDFKTSSKGTPSALNKNYKTQVSFYAEALRKMGIVAPIKVLGFVDLHFDDESKNTPTLSISIPHLDDHANLITYDPINDRVANNSTEKKSLSISSSSSSNFYINDTEFLPIERQHTIFYNGKQEVKKLENDSLWRASLQVKIKKDQDEHAGTVVSVKKEQYNYINTNGTGYVSIEEPKSYNHNIIAVVRTKNNKYFPVFQDTRICLGDTISYRGEVSTVEWIGSAESYSPNENTPTLKDLANMEDSYSIINNNLEDSPITTVYPKTLSNPTTTSIDSPVTPSVVPPSPKSENEDNRRTKQDKREDEGGGLRRKGEVKDLRPFDENVVEVEFTQRNWVNHEPAEGYDEHYYYRNSVAIVHLKGAPEEQCIDIVYDKDNGDSISRTQGVGKDYFSIKIHNVPDEDLPKYATQIAKMIPNRYFIGTYETSNPQVVKFLNLLYHKGFEKTHTRDVLRDGVKYSLPVLRKKDENDKQLDGNPGRNLISISPISTEESSIPSNKQESTKENESNNITPGLRELQSTIIGVVDSSYSKFNNPSYGTVLSIMNDTGAFQFLDRGCLKEDDEITFIVTYETFFEETGEEKSKPIIWIVTKNTNIKYNNGNENLNKKFHNHQVLNILDTTNASGNRKILIDQIKAAYNSNPDSDIPITLKVSGVNAGVLPQRKAELTEERRKETTLGNTNNTDTTDTTNLIYNKEKKQYGFNQLVRDDNGKIQTVFKPVQLLYVPGFNSQEPNSAYKATSFEVTISEDILNNNLFKARRVLHGNWFLLVPDGDKNYRPTQLVYLVNPRGNNKGIGEDAFVNSLTSGHVLDLMVERIIAFLTKTHKPTRFWDFLKITALDGTIQLMEVVTKKGNEISFSFQDKQKVIKSNSFSLTKEEAQNPEVLKAKLGDYMKSLIDSSSSEEAKKYTVTLTLNAPSCQEDPNILQALIADGLLYCPHSFPQRLGMEQVGFIASIPDSMVQGSKDNTESQNKPISEPSTVQNDSSSSIFSESKSQVSQNTVVSQPTTVIVQTPEINSSPRKSRKHSIKETKETESTVIQVGTKNQNLKKQKENNEVIKNKTVQTTKSNVKNSKEEQAKKNSKRCK